MNSQDLATFNQAVQLAQNGLKQVAYEQLKNLAWRSPNNSNILLWMAFTSPSLAEAQSSIERATQLEPSNPNLAAARSWLEGEKAKAPAALQGAYATRSIQVENYQPNSPHTFVPDYYAPPPKSPQMPQPATYQPQVQVASFPPQLVPPQPSPEPPLQIPTSEQPQNQVKEEAPVNSSAPVERLVGFGERRLAIGKSQLPLWSFMLGGLVVLVLVVLVAFTISGGSKSSSNISLASPGAGKDSTRGVSSRDGLQSYFKYINYLTFNDPTTTPDGEQVTGKSKDGTLIVNLIGPKAKLVKADLLFNGELKQNSRAAGYLASFTNLVTTSWERDEIDKWVDHSLQTAQETEEDVVKFRDDVKLTLHVSQASKSLNFTVEWVK